MTHNETPNNAKPLTERLAAMPWKGGLQPNPAARALSARLAALPWRGSDRVQSLQPQPKDSER